MATAAPRKFYLCVLKPVTVFAGRVNGAPSEPYMSITWDGGATGTASTVGTSGAPEIGNTVWIGSAAGQRDGGVIRARSWSPAGPTDPSTGILGLAESDDVGPQIGDDNFITIKLEWRLWSKAPRLVRDGQAVTYFEDFDISYSDQTDDWWPTVVAGPPAVVFLENGTGSAYFVGDRSTLHAPGASWASHRWRGHGSLEGVSTAQGTTGSPVIFSWTSPGQYLVDYMAVDSNGNTGSSATWAFVVNRDDPTENDAAYLNYTPDGDNFDWSSGGGEGGFTVYGVGSITQFPQEALVILATDTPLDTPTASWPFRENVQFVGQIVGNSVRQDPIRNTVTFRAASIQRLMANLKSFPLSLRDSADPDKWIDASNITLDRVVAFMAKWRSTLDTMTPIIYSGYAPLIPRQDFGPSTLYNQLQSELMKDAWGRVVANHQGVLHLEIDYNHMLTGERAAVRTRKTLTKANWIIPVDVVERHEYDQPTSKVKASGIQYAGGGDPQQNVTPLFSEAPGDSLPRQFGNEVGGSSFILNNQTDLNIRCGFMLAKETQRFPTLRMKFINDGSFQSVPQEVFPSQIEAGDNNRGLSFPGTELVPRRIRRSYDTVNGVVVVDVDFEPSSTGPPGVTIEMPATPPSAADPGVDIVPPTPAWPPVEVALLAFRPEGSARYHGLGGADWEARDKGLGGADLRATHGGVDPWWWTREKKNTSNPDEAIWFKHVVGGVLRTTNAGRLGYDDITPASPSTITGTTFVGFESDLFKNERHIMLGRWEGTGSVQHSGLWMTNDDGESWAFKEIT